MKFSNLIQGWVSVFMSQLGKIAYLQINKKSHQNSMMASLFYVIGWISQVYDTSPETFSDLDHLHAQIAYFPQFLATGTEYPN